MNRIKELRKDAGLTQKEFAKIIGITDASISKYENGDMIPKIDKLEKMSDIFGVTVEYITGESDLKISPKLRDLVLKANSGDQVAKEKLDFQYVTRSEDEKYLLHLFRLLNETGESEALKQIENLTKISDYRK